MSFVIANKVVISVTFGTLDAGGVATFSDDEINFACQATDFSFTKNVKTIDTRALCEENEAHIPISRGGTAEFTARVPANGARTFLGKEGLPIRMEVKAAATQTTPDIYAGIVASVAHAGQMDELQTEKVSVTLGVRVA